MHIHLHDRHEILAERGPVLIRVLAGEGLDRSRVDRACELLDAMLERYCAVGLIVMFEHDTPLPSRDILAYIRERFDPYGERVVVAVVMLGLGFWLSSFLRMARKFRSQHTVLPSTSVQDGVEQLALELVGLDTEALARDCEALRARLAGP